MRQIRNEFPLLLKHTNVNFVIRKGGQTSHTPSKLIITFEIL